MNWFDKAFYVSIAGALIFAVVQVFITLIKVMH